MPKIAMTGASGYLGQFIVSHLLEQNIQIKALTREPIQSKKLFPHIQWVKGELSETTDYSDFFDGCDGIIHGAFHHIRGLYRGGEGDDLQTFLNKNINGSLNLLQQAAHLSYGVFISSRAVYGQSQQTDEDAPTSPDSHYGIYKDKIEKAIIKENWPLSIIRPTGIYGIINPLESSKWYHLIHSMKYNLPYPSPHEGTEVHGYDVAKAVSLLLHPKYKGEIFNCSDFHISHQEIIQMLCDIYHINVPLPPPFDRRVHPMNTDKLRAIGWQASELEMLKNTLKSLYEKI